MEYTQLDKEKKITQKMSTCNRFELKTLGILTDYAHESPPETAWSQRKQGAHPQLTY